MAGITIKYNEVDWLEALNELSSTGRAVVTDANRNVAANFNNNYQDQGMHRYGQQFLYSTLSVKQISTSIKLVGNQAFFNEAAGLIGKFLNVTEPKKMVFGDEPDKVWEAIASGQPALTVDNSTSPATATITITFDVPKSYSEGQTKCLVDTSSSSKYGTITKVTNDHYKINLNNLGSAVAYPKFKIKHNSDNGWCGIVKSQTENYEIGNPEEADGKSVKNSEVLLDYTNGKITKGFQDGTKNIAILNTTNQDINGELFLDEAWGRNHLALHDRGIGTQTNKGASLTWTIPADANGEAGALNEYIWWRQIFWLGSSNQYGFMKICVSDTNDKFLYGVETFKRANGLGCEYNFLVSDGNDGYRIPLRWTFLGTHADNENPFNATRGWSDLMRRDDEIQVYWLGGYPKIRVPEIKGRKSAKIHVFFGDIGATQQVTHMYLDQILYRKDFVPGWQDVPNRYRAGSVLEIDMSKGKTYVDNLPTMDGLSYLAEPFGLDPGANEIDIYFSSWIAKAPDIEVTWYERSV